MYAPLKLIAPRSTFPADMSAEEAAAMQAHSLYWQEHAESGKAIAVGPVFSPSGAFGFAFIEVADLAEARTLANNDPIVTAGLGFSYEVSPVPSLILRQSAPPAP